MGDVFLIAYSLHPESNLDYLPVEYFYSIERHHFIQLNVINYQLIASESRDFPFCLFCENGSGLIMYCSFCQ